MDAGYIEVVAQSVKIPTKFLILLHHDPPGGSFRLRLLRRTSDDDISECDWVTCRQKGPIGTAVARTGRLNDVCLC